MATTNDWVTHPRPNPQARLRLFCFPYAGGAASIFYPWPDDLPLDVAICPIQLPGRENRLGEPLFTRLSPLMQVLAQAIRPHLDLPFAFFGHSMGAIISFELARQLRKQGDPGPVQLFVSGNQAPQIACRDSPIHQLPEAEFIEEIRKFSGIPEAVLQNTEFLQLFLPILRADFAIHDTYTYTADETLACPISAFGGLQDKEVSRDDLAAWRDQTRSTFRLRMLPGDHFFLHSARTPLLQAISQDLCNSCSK
jgi:medium-chain acyl-[acyl-carrier-protein] hydrolase